MSCAAAPRASILPGRLLSPRPTADWTLGQFVLEIWWPRYAIPNLSPKTRDTYLREWGNHIYPYLAGLRIADIDAVVIEDWCATLRDAGVGAPTMRKSVMMVQGILRHAVKRYGLVSHNPVLEVRKPSQHQLTGPRPFSPLQVERIRREILDRATRDRWVRERDAALVSMMAYAGLRPVEDRGANWSDLGTGSLTVLGKGGRTRVIKLLAPLLGDLRAWRTMNTAAGAIITRQDGGRWTEWDWRNWRRRVWRPAIEAVGIDGDQRPYRLRGSFVSLLLWEGRSVAYVAAQAGHSVQTLSRYYAGVIADLEDGGRVSAVDAIDDARRIAGTAHTRLDPQTSTPAR